MFITTVLYTALPVTALRLEDSKVHIDSDSKHCSGCDAEMDPDAIFCNECGMAEPAAVGAGGPQSEISRVSDAADGGKHNAPLPQADPYEHIVPPTIIQPMTDLLCPGCNKAYATDDKFCRHCAFDLSKIAKVSSAQFCTGCGKPFEPSDRFCRHCSMDLSNSDHTVVIPVVTRPSAPEMTIAQTLSTANPASIDGAKPRPEMRDGSGMGAVNYANDAVLPATGPSYTPPSTKPEDQRLRPNIDSEYLHHPVVSSRAPKRGGSGLGVAIGCIGALLMITSFVAIGWARNYIQKNLITSGLGGLIGYQDSTYELAKAVQEIAPLGLIAGLVLLIVGGVLAIARRL